MILAATDWLSISINLLLILFVIICLLMTLMILMQRPKQEGLGAAFGGGMTDQMFGARTTNVLQRATVWFASLFFVIAMTLAVLIGMKNSRTESLVGADETAETGDAAEASPDAQTLETIRSLIENSDLTLEEAPVEEAPVEDAPVEDAPVEDAPVEDAPAGETAPEESVDPEEESEDR